MAIFLDPLDEDSEEKYLKRLKDGDQGAKKILVEHNLRLVAYIAKKYVGSGEDRTLEELISIGTIGLIKAITNFDVNKGKLSTYAARCIENEILMTLRGDRKRLREVSIYEPIGIDTEGNTLSIYDIIESNEKQIDEVIETQIGITKLSNLIESVLDEREKIIIKSRYGIDRDGEMTQREIAKEMGISRSYVSRIEKRAIEKLREAFEE